jgi:nitroreductase
MKVNYLIQLIKSRRSVRKFKNQKVSKKTVEDLLESGRWAPSGLNNQPWRFMVKDSAEKDQLAEYTKFSQIIKEADKLILVFLDKKSLYSRPKDLMAIGACIQNILLYAHSLGLGSCWLGEILNQSQQIQAKLQTPPELELLAAIAVGVPEEEVSPKDRKPLKDLIIKGVRS